MEVEVGGGRMLGGMEWGETGEVRLGAGRPIGRWLLLSRGEELMACSRGEAVEQRIVDGSRCLLGMVGVGMEEQGRVGDEVKIQTQIV